MGGGGGDSPKQLAIASASSGVRPMSLKSIDVADGMQRSQPASEVILHLFTICLGP